MPRGARHVIAREAPFAQSDTEKTVRDDARTSGHETALLKVAVRARPYGRSTGTGAFAENVVGQAVCGR